MTDQAQVAYLRAVATDPRHINANLQLAGISLERREGEQALKYLTHLPVAEQSTVPAQLLRAQALFWNGQRSAADQILSSLESQSAGDPRLSFPLGMAYVGMEQFDNAEKAFGRALRHPPEVLRFL